MKICSRCRKMKPFEDFTRNKNSGDGRHSWCRPCHVLGRKGVKLGTRPGRPPKLDLDMVRCTGCKETKPKSEFSKDKLKSTGVRSRCKKCSARYTRKRYQEVAEERRQYSREYAKRNRERFVEYAARRRAFENAAKGDGIDVDYLRSRDSSCYWCGDSLTDKYHVDHLIPLSRGGNNDTDNAALMHPQCNVRKRNLLPEEIAEPFRSRLMERMEL